MDNLTVRNIVGPSRLGPGQQHRLLRLLWAWVSGVLLSAALPLVPVLAASGVYYLKGDGVPSASLSASAPTTGALPDYNGNGPGLLLEISDVGLGETDPDKYQIWATPTGSIDLDGAASLTFWSATADFEGGQRGVVLAGLYDCDSALSGCNLIQQAQLDIADWSGGSTTWVEHVINFGSITHSIATERTLALKLVVGNNAYDDMVFAYDTTSYPSRLTVQLAPFSTTTTTTTTTTTLMPPTTTTTSTTAATTTTIPGATTTTVPGVTTTTGATSTTVPGSAIPSDSTTTTDSLVPSNAAPPEDQSGGQTSGDNDPGLPPLLDPGQMDASAPVGLSGAFIDGLELVIPPFVATALVSPLLILEALAAALVDSGRALLIPGLLLLVGAAWVAYGSRLTGLLGYRRRRRQEEAEQ